MKKLLTLVIVVVFVGGCGSDHPADRFCLEEDGKIVCYDPEDCSTDEYGRITCVDPDPYIEDDPCYQQECTGECTDCGTLTMCAHGFCVDACEHLTDIYVKTIEDYCETDPTCPDCDCWNIKKGYEATLLDENGDYDCIPSQFFPRECTKQRAESNKDFLESFNAEEFYNSRRKRCEEVF